MPTQDASAAYWEGYDGLQLCKHRLLRRYLQAWFPILAHGYSKLLYIETHAGRGHHLGGEKGSPLVAIETAQEYLASANARDVTVHMLLIEADPDNARYLRAAIAEATGDSNRLSTRVLQARYEDALLDRLRTYMCNPLNRPAIFCFVDPYGPSLSMATLRRVLAASPSAELLVTLMVRYADMHAHLPDQHERNLDALYGTDAWRKLLAIEPYEKRVEAMAMLFGRQLGTKHMVWLPMKQRNGAVMYALVHCTDSAKGLEEIKRAIWKVFPDGHLEGHEERAPEQMDLFCLEPDLRALERMLWARYAGKEVPNQEIEQWLATTMYLPKHAHDLLRGYHRADIVRAHSYGNRFAFKNNPVFVFPDKRPG